MKDHHAPRSVGGTGGVFPLRDLDAVVRAARHSPGEALALCEQQVLAERPRLARSDDWEDVLAREIVEGRVGELRDWAHANSMAPETGFADQAHMSRCVLEMTGARPGEWRAR